MIDEKPRPAGDPYQKDLQHYTVEIKTARFGVWHLADVVFSNAHDAAHYVDEMDHHHPGLISDWKVVETLLSVTHTWTKLQGLTPVRPK